MTCGFIHSPKRSLRFQEYFLKLILYISYPKVWYWILLKACFVDQDHSLFSANMWCMMPIVDGSCSAREAGIHFHVCLLPDPPAGEWTESWGSRWQEAGGDVAANWPSQSSVSVSQPHGAGYITASAGTLSTTFNRDLSRIFKLSAFGWQICKKIVIFHIWLLNVLIIYMQLLYRWNISECGVK